MNIVTRIRFFALQYNCVSVSKLAFNFLNLFFLTVEKNIRKKNTALEKLIITVLSHQKALGC